MPEHGAQHLVVGDGWFYTGGLENHPDLIARLDRLDAPYGRLLGNGADSLRKIRDPFWVNRILREWDLPALDLRPGSHPPGRDGRWMRKPLASAGGHQVEIWDSRSSEAISEVSCYFQRRQNGQTLSALFYRCGDSTTLLGITRQIIQHPWSCAPQPFSYCGSIGPWQALSGEDLSPGRHQQVEGDLRIMANVLGDKSDLRGLFGLDFILDDNSVPWIVEINPRYTASVEVLELARQNSLLAPGPGPSFGETRVVAKLILFSPDSMKSPDLGRLRGSSSIWSIPEVADIPVPASEIAATWPICTVLADGETEADCLKKLALRVDNAWKLVNLPGAGESPGPSVLDQLGPLR